MTWNFDARTIEPGAAFERWPLGWFPVVITKAEEKLNTGDDDGMTWHLSIKGLDGPVKDKTSVIQIPHKNSNQQRMDIAVKTMSAIMHVCNVLSFQHPGQLANIPFYVKSGERKAKTGDTIYQDWPEFKNTAGETALDVFRRLNGQGGAAASAQQPQQAFGAPQQPAQQQSPAGFGQPQPGGAPNPNLMYPGVNGNPGPTPGAYQTPNGGWPQAGQQLQPAPVQQFAQQPAPQAGGWPQGQPTQPQQPMQPQQGFVQQAAPGAPGEAPWGPGPQPPQG